MAQGDEGGWWFGVKSSPDFKQQVKTELGDDDSGSEE